MKASPSVLERNIALLLSRAYRPARPSLAFRARLVRAIEQNLEALPAPNRSKRSTAPRVRTRTWRIAAAALILLSAAAATFAWYAGTHVTPALGVDELLAGGHCALREGSPPTWRALSANESSQGIELGSHVVELATPEKLGARVWLDASGRLDADPSSRLSIALDEASLSVDLAAGGLALERYAAGGTWRVSTTQGAITLEHGAIEIAYAGPASVAGERCVRARLRAGRAFAEVQPSSLELESNAEILLCRGRVLTDGLLEPAADGAQRANAVSASQENPTSASQPVPDVSADTAPLTASIRGRLRVSRGENLPTDFSLTLLRAERLPVVSQPQRSKHTSATGEFEITGLSPGEYSLYIEARGFAVWRAEKVALFPDPAQEVSVLDVALERGGSARGLVVEAATGKPIEGAVVISETDAPAQVVPFDLLELLPAARAWASLAITGPDGTFEITTLSRGAHVLRATQAGFAAAWSEKIDLSANDTRDGIRFELKSAGTIGGHVARADGTPWPGAAIVASRIDYTGNYRCMSFGYALADGEGAFEVGDLAPGIYVVLNVSEAEAGAKKTVSPRVVQVQVEAGQRTRVDLPGGAHGTRLFGVVSTHDGAPLEGLDITLEPRGPLGPVGSGGPGGTKEQDNTWQAQRTGERGEYAFEALAPGRYQVFLGRGLGTQFVLQGEVDVPAAREHRFDITMNEGEIRGRVLDGASGKILPNSVVILQVEKDGKYEFAGRHMTGEDALFDFDHLADGTWRVIAYALVGHYGPETSAPQWINAGQRARTADVTLFPGAAFTVLVDDAAGRPVEDADIEITDERGAAIQFSPSDRTDPHGLFRVNGVQPGRWNVAVTRIGFERATKSIELSVGDDREVRVVLSPADRKK